LLAVLAGKAALRVAREEAVSGVSNLSLG
jgi:hypothetical protein